MGLAKHAIDRLVGAFVWVVALVCFSVLVTIGLGPHTGRYTTLTVLSGSMLPGIPVGAVVVDTPEPADALRVGQIVTYAIPVEDHRVITHRVVKIITGGRHPVFLSKGDANNAVDPWQAQVTSTSVWRVRTVVPGLGRAIHWLRAPTVHLIGVVLLPIVVGLWWVVSFWRNNDDHGPDVVPGAAAS